MIKIDYKSLFIFNSPEKSTCNISKIYNHMQGFAEDLII